MKSENVEKISQKFWRRLTNWGGAKRRKQSESGPRRMMTKSRLEIKPAHGKRSNLVG